MPRRPGRASLAESLGSIPEGADEEGGGDAGESDDESREASGASPPGDETLVRASLCNDEDESLVSAAAVSVDASPENSTTGTSTTGSSTASVVSSRNTFVYRPAGPRKGASNQSSGGARRSSAMSNESVEETMRASNCSSNNGASRSNNRLTAISAMYDLDGDGELNEAERIMRALDAEGRGHLTNEEVKTLVERQLEARKDMKLYRKLAGGLAGLVAVLAVSNLGTSWASALLSRETVAEPTSGTIQSVATGEVVGVQHVAHTIELEAYTEDEYRERRSLIVAALEADPDHEDHLHRKLGKRRDNKCACSKVAYDQGRIPARDLEELAKKCDGANTVQMKRRWRDIDGAEDDSYDYDAICSPGTRIVRKQKKKRNRHGTKVEVVDERVTFVNTGRNGRDRSVSFTCTKGQCHASGTALLQREGHPCHVSRGADECDEGLVCYHHDQYDDNITLGLVGVCTRLQKYARRRQVCDVDLGVDACEAGHACYPSTKEVGSRDDAKLEVGAVRTGLCRQVQKQAGPGAVCDVSLGANACLADYDCIGAHGLEIKAGLGICATIARSSLSNLAWRVDYKRGTEGQCIQISHADVWEEDETYATAGECCSQSLWWMSMGQCAPEYF